MGIELTNAGETLAAIVVSDELSKQANGDDGKQPASPDEGTATTCTNCGTRLAGAYCHACGQSAHIHRSLLHMFEEVLHGIFHFDTKAWRTIPALIKRPGQLTKDYIQGKRTSYVSPLALFLFLIFLMFFVFSMTMNGPGNEILNIPGSREAVVAELANSETKLAEEQAKLNALPAYSSDAQELRLNIREAQSGIRQLQDSLDEIDGKEIDSKAVQQQLRKEEKNLADLRTKLAPLVAASASGSINATTNTSTDVTEDAGDNQQMKAWELREEIRFAEREVKYYKKRLAKANKTNSESNASLSTSLDASTNAKLSDSSATEQSKNKSGSEDEVHNLSNIPYVGKALAHADKNRELTLYKMKKNAASSAFLLMPISLPFLWLLFAFKRRYVMFDHAVFSLYSLSFMCLLLMFISILAKFDFSGTAGFLFMTAPPVHMYLQLRYAYDLSVFGTLWRTIALLLIALLSLVIYAAVVTLLSA